MMKTVVNRIISWIIVLTIIIGGITLLGWMLRPKDCDNAMATIAAYEKVPEESLDVILYGSSHMWLGINSRLLYNEYGIASFNHGCSWQHINTTDYFIRDSFNNQSPKVIVVDTGRVNETLKDVGMDGEIYYTRGLPWSKDKLRYLKGCFGNDISRYIEYVSPFMAFHTEWDNMEADSLTADNNNPDMFIESLGYLGNGDAVPVNILDPKEFWQEPLSEDAIHYLDDILTVAKENNAKVLLVTIPSYSGEYMYGNALEEYAIDRGCDYIDFFKLADEIGLDGDKDFYDPEHLNIDGSAKVTTYLGNYLKEHYDVPDRREITDDTFKTFIEKND